MCLTMIKHHLWYATLMECRLVPDGAWGGNSQNVSVRQELEIANFNSLIHHFQRARSCLVPSLYIGRCTTSTVCVSTWACWVEVKLGKEEERDLGLQLQPKNGYTGEPIPRVGLLCNNSSWRI